MRNICSEKLKHTSDIRVMIPYMSKSDLKVVSYQKYSLRRNYCPKNMSHLISYPRNCCRKLVAYMFMLLYKGQINLITFNNYFFKLKHQSWLITNFYGIKDINALAIKFNNHFKCVY